MTLNARAQIVRGLPPPTKTFGLNSLVCVTLRPGVRVWVALIKLEGNWRVAGFWGAGSGSGWLLAQGVGGFD